MPLPSVLQKAVLMKLLYIDCGMGAAGDMLTAALLELMPDPDAVLSELNAAGIPNVEILRQPAVKCGVSGTRISVLIHGEEATGHPSHAHEHDHGHTTSSDLHGIGNIISGLRIPDRVKDNVMAVYESIAAAESAVHGVPVEKIHFHEVGALDAVADVTAVCLLMDRLAPDEVVVSPVCVGGGEVRCAHGILPVPAPATAHILRGVPIYGGGINSELCTPTGAALLKHFAARFGDMPPIRTIAVGCGMGKKDFERANCVRAFWGEGNDRSDTVAILSCNVDDMTAEEIGFAMDRLFDGGAREVFTVPVGMKKNRPGTLLQVICDIADREHMVQLLFHNTSTIGIRETETRRYVLDRREEKWQTAYGDVRVKRSTGYGVVRDKIEYDDLARIAAEQGTSLAEIRARLNRK